MGAHNDEPPWQARVNGVSPRVANGEDSEERRPPWTRIAMTEPISVLRGVANPHKGEMLLRFNLILCFAHPDTEAYFDRHGDISVRSLPRAERRKCRFDGLLWNFAQTLDWVWQAGGSYVWAHFFWLRDFDETDDPLLVKCRSDVIDKTLISPT